MLAWILKLGTPIITGIGSNVIRIAVVAAFVSLGGFTWLVQHDAKIRAAALASCPPQHVYTGNPVVNNYPPKKMHCFPFTIGNWGSILCHN